MLGKMQVLIMIVVVLTCFAFSGTAFADTEVSGIISQDTTWSKAGSPYIVKNTIQIAYGASLTIKPGVIVNGFSNNIEVWGTLNSIGNDNSKITFNNVNILVGEAVNYNEHYNINIQYSEINYGSIMKSPTCGHGTFILRDSTIQNTSSYIDLWYPSNNCFIERNIFNKAGGISVGTDGIKVYITNNAFYEQTTPYAVENWADYSKDTINTIIEYNSFLSTNKIALSLKKGYSNSHMIAINNYWNTTDSAVIDSMIYDKKDNLACSDYIEYKPFLNNTNPSTPILEIPTYSSVQGYVYGITNPSNIEVTLGNNITHTDQNGFFKFDNTQTGRYILKAKYLFCKCNPIDLTIINSEPINQNLELIPGDYNSDNKIDLSDLIMFSRNYGR